MIRLQKWFEQIAGLHLEERQRWEQAREIFCTRPLDLHRLQTPACWRRRKRLV